VEDPRAAHISILPDSDYRSEILRALQSFCAPSMGAASEARRCNFHCILRGLHLGNVHAFAESTNLSMLQNPLNQRSLIVHNNHHGFQIVISVCPVNQMAEYCLDLANQDLTAALAQVEWLYVGRAILDGVHLWYSLVHDCTFLNSPLALKELPETRDEQRALNQAKQEAVLKLDPRMWFGPVFFAIDKAVFRNHKALVHCIAGISRSATVLAAYLIWRFNLSAQEAIDYLKLKRACVDPQFVQPLHDYAISLQFVQSGYSM